MNDSATPEADDVDLGAYCRRVEEFLTQVNGGHLVRVVGPAFEILREWAYAAVPLSIVFEGIRAKAARHQAGGSKRPLRLEFCKDDVCAVFDRWRRAVGPVAGSGMVDGAGGDLQKVRRAPSLARHLDRVIERLVRAANRVDVPAEFRAAVERAIGGLSAIRARASRVRGDERAAIVHELAQIDRHLVDDVKATLSPALLADFTAESVEDLGAFRTRMTPEAWNRVLALGVDRVMRERLGLPTIEFHP